MSILGIRKIVVIDEEKCDGCGDCVPSCAEGAIRIIDGKARLIAENLCDGMGACLGECPRGAISIEERPADGFSPQAVEARKARGAAPPGPPPGGCPGSALRVLGAPGARGPSPRDPAVNPAAPGEARSRLSHWPVQLALLPPGGRVFEDAHLLIAADCVPFAMPDFHERLLAGRTLAVGCPKLDDVRPYVEKLAQAFSRSNVLSVTVAHMEVPCCTGILRVVEAALERAGRKDIPLKGIIVGVDGTIR